LQFAIKDIAQLILNQRQGKREIAATLVFVCTGHWNFQQMTTVTS